MSAPDVHASLRGQLAVATPLLADPPFRRAVVLLLDHDHSGALGVILNRPTTVAVLDVLPSWTELVSAPDVLFSGGPVSTNAALGLASVAGLGLAGSPVGWQQLYEQTGLVDLDSPPELLVGALAGLRIFAGYAGWAPGQLEDEIAEGAWYVVAPEPADVFGRAPQDLWRGVLRRQAGDLRMVASFPEDPALN